LIVVLPIIFFVTRVAQRNHREPQRKKTIKNSAVLSVFSAALCVTKKSKKGVFLFIRLSVKPPCRLD